MKTALFGALMCATAFHAGATPASTESVEVLLAVTKTESMMDSMYGGMEQMMRQGMQQALGDKTITDEQRKVLDAVPGKFVSVIKQELSWERLRPKYVDLYQSTFEQEEIDGLIAFYRGPAGQAFIKKMPIVLQKSVAISQSQLQTLIPKMKAAMEEALAEAKVTK